MPVRSTIHPKPITMILVKRVIRHYVRINEMNAGLHPELQ
jgi:hypothetical protein